MGTLCSKTQEMPQRRMKEENTRKIQVYEKGALSNSLEFPEISSASIQNFYTFTKYLGAGGFGSVRLAKSKLDGGQFAVKTIMKERVKGKEYLIMRELSILKALDHPNIIKFHEIYQDDLCFHIVTENCSGGELLQRLLFKNGKPQDQQLIEIQQIMRQLLSAINYLHSKNVCHRDLKPQNVLFATSESNADLKLIDFGLSAFFENSTTVQSYFKSRVGTLMYVAPEVLKEQYTSKCDIWSLGVIFFILLSGEVPYKFLDKGELYLLVEKGRIDFTSKIWNVINPKATKLLHLMLKLKPNERPCASELLKNEWLQNKSNELSPLIHNKQILENIYKNFVASQKLKREVLLILVNQLEEEEIKGLRKVFEKINKDKSGMISYEELSKGLKEVGYQASEKEILAIIKNIHQD